MTPSPDLGRLLPDEDGRLARRDAMVNELRRATPATSSKRGTRRSVARGALALTSAAGIAAVGSFVVPEGAGSPLGVVAQARAAIMAPGEILHVRLRFEPGQYGGLANVSDAAGQTIGRLTGEIERWSTSGPPREHTTLFLAPAFGGGPSPTMETDYAAGVLRSHDSWQSTVSQEDHLSPQQRQTLDQTDSPRLGVGFSADPVIAIRTLLSAGTLRVGGHQNLGGRDVVSLLGQTTSRATADGSPSTISYEYLVDATTYAPVQITSTQVLTARSNDPEPAARTQRQVVTRWVFETFERIPLTDATAGLLRISTAPGCAAC